MRRKGVTIVLLIVGGYIRRRDIKPILYRTTRHSSKHCVSGTKDQRRVEIYYKHYIATEVMHWRMADISSSLQRTFDFAQLQTTWYITEPGDITHILITAISVVFPTT